MNESYTRAPHQRTPQHPGSSPNAALLIDFDNVTMAMRSNLGQELRNFLNSDIVRGKVSVQRAYADWRRYPQYIVPLSEASIDLIFAPAYGSSKKNATDIRLAIDALELVFTRPEIGTYILLSGDSDFSSLVLKLKEFGKYVIGVGLQESTSDLLVQNCDEYYSYNSLSGLTSAEELDTSSLGPWELVEKAVQRMAERNDVMRSDRLKQVMLEIDGGFDEKDHGFSKFNRFLAEASSRGLVRLRKIGDGHYEVAPVEREEEPASEPREPPSPPEPIAAPGEGAGEAGEEPAPSGASDGGSRGRGTQQRGGRQARQRAGPGGDGRGDGGGRGRSVEAGSLREAYDLLTEVVDDLSDDGAPVRDSEIKREILRRNESFDEAALGFSKFSRFLRQAYDEGVVELTTDPDGNFHLQPAGAEPVTFEEPAREESGDAGEAGGQPERAEPSPREEAGGQPSPGRGAPSAEEEPEPEPRSAAGTEASGDADDGAGPAAPRDEQPAASGEAGSGRRRGGLGRFRRGSRGPSSPSGSEGSEVAETSVGPVDESPDDGAADEGPAAEEGERAASGGPASDGGQRRRRPSGGLGRFRRGRGSAPDREDEEGSSEPDDGGTPTPGPVDAADEGGAEEPEDAPGGSGAGRADVSADGGGAPEAPIPERAADDPVGYMVGNYPGVGRKTAEKLVEAFGDSLFEVIDREPGRLTKVLPDHRARAVVDAREAEREEQGS